VRVRLANGEFVRDAKALFFVAARSRDRGRRCSYRRRSNEPRTDKVALFGRLRRSGEHGAIIVIARRF